MINNTTLVGRLTKKPELQKTSSGVSYCKFSIAVQRPYASANGEREADFPSCIVWKTRAENLCRFMDKGSLIGVIGSIQTGSYQHTEGHTVYTTTVVAENIQYLESKKQTDMVQEEPRANKSNFKPKKKSSDLADSLKEAENTWAEMETGKSSEPSQGIAKWTNGTHGIDIEDDLPF